MRIVDDEGVEIYECEDGEVTILAFTSNGLSVLLIKNFDDLDEAPQHAVIATAVASMLAKPGVVRQAVEEMDEQIKENRKRHTRQ